ncbi:MAG: hypothetical protein L6R35_001308 [Caloplaca aegaea]|nr:MAG: hypothetical protein L6R35_001308 [Caloplaca aegaea]
MAQDEARRRQEIDAWLSGPASEPPPGVASNFIDGPSLHDYNDGTTVGFVCDTVEKEHKMTAAVATSVLAWLGLVAFSIVIAESDRYGSGKHTWDVRGSDYVVYNKLANAVQLTYTLVILLTKVSILLLYFRLFSPTRVMRVAIHVNLWANVLYYVVVSFLVLLMCNPREAIWNPYLENVKCLDTRALKITSASFNLISDLAILFIPIFTVWRLQMQRKKKLMTIAVFTSGLL